MTRDPYRFIHRLRVRWAECDMQGIVFNPHYMAYVDVALTEYWRAIEYPYPAAFLAEGVDSFMVAAAQTFRKPAVFDDELDVALRTEYLGTSSLRVLFEIRHDGVRLFDGSATYVIACGISRQPRTLGDRLVQHIISYESTPPMRKAK